MSESCTAYVALGGNIGTEAEITERFSDAIAALSRLQGIGQIQISRIYRSSAWGPIAQNDYLNCVICFECSITAPELLQQLLKIEQNFGRTRSDEQRWGPRTLDLDILLFGRQIHAQPDLQLPHPRMHQRLFVLLPLADLAPELNIKDHGHIRDLVSACCMQAVAALAVVPINATINTMGDLQ